MVALVARHVTAVPSVRSMDLRCPQKSESAFSEVITARPPRRATIAALQADVAGVLRSSGWHVVPVPARKVPMITSVTSHPIDDIAREALRGAVNILPDARAGAYALIFINSGCATARNG
jgi:hypothetical protein